MKKLLQDKSTSLICHLILAIGVLPFVLLYPKSVSLMFINGHHSAFLDVVMYHITRLPELAFIVFVVVLAFFAERRILMAVIIAMAFCGICIVLFKNFIFPDFFRPYHWLNGNKVAFHNVPGIHLHSNGSFPSGHTISAFCALALVGFISKKSWVQFLLFLLACLSGYSRVYAAQHYLMDVYAGAIFGFTVALIVYHIFTNNFKTPFWSQPLIKF